MKKIRRSALCLLAAALLLLSACSPLAPSAAEQGPLTWTAWGGYEAFRALAKEAYPEIEWELEPYDGANRTGYSWAQMRAGDIPDLFVTSQILDGELAKERLADLSNYEFVDHLPTAILDQVSVDGGIYLLPVTYGMYGIFYNRTLMEEHGWQLPANFDELEALCARIREAGLIPGVAGTQLTGNTFSALFNLAKTDWLTTPAGVAWERDFLAGNATAAGRWEGTMEYAQRYLDIGMFTTDPEDRGNPEMILDYLGNRKAVFCTAVMTVNITELPKTGDRLGMMPYIGEDGSKNVYMYSPTSYIGLSKRLTEPGNEEKLADALKLLSLLYSPEGQAAFISDQTPCVLSVLDSMVLPEDALIYDAQQATREGRAFPMTYAHWENVLADMGQAFKEWFRGENGMDGPKCIARMDELQRASAERSENLYFCESTADFTLQETGLLLGKALGSAVKADAALIPIGTSYHEGSALRACATGRLYAGKINADVAATILPAYIHEYARMTMTGAQLKELAAAGFDAFGDGEAFPYVLAMKGGGEPEDDKTYQVALIANGYTEEIGRAFGVQTEQISFPDMLQDWLTQQKTVSPDGNPWN